MRLARLYAILGAVLAILEGGCMIARKQFLRDGFGLAAILSAQTAPAIIVRSMVAARNGIMAATRGGWVNPYVTDGLVAMWDGEWNAGGGVHDANLAFSSWANLGSASCPLEYQDSNIGSRWQWSNDGANLIPNARANLRSLSFTVPQNPNNNFTLDYCVAGATTSFNNYYFNSYGQGTFRSFRGGTTNGLYVGGYGGYSVSPGITNASIVSDGSTLKGCWNGAANKNLAYTFERGSETNMVLNILGSNFVSIHGSSMHCFRIYSRALTAAEIAANYAVDKQRFNLA